MIQVVFHADALQELRAQAVFYEEHSVGLVERFVSQVQAAVRGGVTGAHARVLPCFEDEKQAHAMESVRIYFSYDFDRHLTNAVRGHGASIQ